MTLAFTITRVFQVQKNAGLEVVGSGRVRGQKVFQVRFKLFQVRVGSIWGRNSYVAEGEKIGENGCKCWEISGVEEFLSTDGHSAASRNHRQQEETGNREQAKR